MADIIKEQIHPEGSPDTVIYPETSFDQVKDPELYEHNINITGTATFDNTLKCDINCLILSKNSTSATFSTIVKGTYIGTCTMYKEDSASSTSMDMKGTAGKFTILDSAVGNDTVELVIDYTDGTTNSLEFRVSTFSDTVTNVFQRSIIIGE